MARFIFARFLFAFAIAAGSLLSTELSAEESRTPPNPPPTPVTRQEVWQAVAAELRERGLAEPQLPRVEDLDLPVALPALAGRKLRVSSECWDAGPRRTQFLLQCGQPGQCLPFLVYVRASANADARARGGSCRLGSGSRLVSKASPNSTPQPTPPPTVRNGDRATAVFLADRMRMTASVTCLERGLEGEVIHVRGPDGHVFRARISGPALLEALPQ
jgi:hypothetical protein